MLIDAAKQGNAVNLKVRSGRHAFTRGKLTRTYGYSAPVLGPVIRLRRGDEVQMTVENALDTVTTVHWHGLLVTGHIDGGPQQLIHRGSCCFQKLDSCVPVMQSAQDCMCDNVSETLDRAPVRCILPKRNMRTPPVIIGGEFRKDPPQVFFVERDQMIGTLAPDRPDQAFNMAVLPGRAE
jgi:hypothetical protein